MVLPTEGYLLRIFIGESDKHHGKPLLSWLTLAKSWNTSLPVSTT